MTCQAYPGSGIITLVWMGLFHLGVSSFYFIPCRLPPVGDFFIFKEIRHFDEFQKAGKNFEKYCSVARSKLPCIFGNLLM